MNARFAVFCLLAVCLAVLMLLATRTFTALQGGVGFALGLAILGLLSGGFRRKPPRN